MKSFHEHTTNKIVYIFGLVVLIFLIIGSVIQNMGLLDITDIVQPCVFRRLSGIYCPGCGGTRAVRALLGGHFFLCLYFHPFVFYCFVMYVIFMLSHTIELIQSHKKVPHRKHSVKGLKFKISYVYIGILIILIQWILKNIMLLVN